MKQTHWFIEKGVEQKVTTVDRNKKKAYLEITLQRYKCLFNRIYHITTPPLIPKRGRFYFAPSVLWLVCGLVWPRNICLMSQARSIFLVKQHTGMIDCF